MGNVGRISCRTVWPERLRVPALIRCAALQNGHSTVPKGQDMNAPHLSDPAGAESSHTARSLVVKRITWEADRVVSLDLVHPDGLDLPSWTAGAHIDVTLPSGLTRQYSLCGQRERKDVYRIAVLRSANSRGGSAEIHDSTLIGRKVEVGGPHNRFQLQPAPEYLFVAGGIGITPIIAMIREVSEMGKPWSLHYGGQCVERMAFTEELMRINEGRVRLFPEDKEGRMPLREIVSAQSTSCEVYCCGPEPMLRDIRVICSDVNPRRILHMEQFGAPANGSDRTRSGVDEFQVELRRSGVILDVPADRSLLDVVRSVVPTVPSSCEQGFCGTCETTVLEGVPEHRDEVLTPEERAEGNTMMICVGRAKSGLLILDL